MPGCFYDSLHIIFTRFAHRLPVLSFRGLTVGSTVGKRLFSNSGTMIHYPCQHGWWLAGGPPRSLSSDKDKC